MAWHRSDANAAPLGGDHATIAPPHTSTAAAAGEANLTAVPTDMLPAGMPTDMSTDMLMDRLTLDEQHFLPVDARRMQARLAELSSAGKTDRTTGNDRPMPQRRAKRTQLRFFSVGWQNPAQCDSKLREQGLVPEWAKSDNPLRFVESLLTNPGKTYAEMDLFARCEPLSQRASDELARWHALTANALGFVPLIGQVQWVGSVAGRLADLIENKPFDSSSELHQLMSQGRLFEVDGTRYSMRHLHVGPEVYDPARPAEPGVPLVRTEDGGLRLDVPEHYAIEPAEQPDPPDRNGISAWAGKSLIRHEARYYHGAYDPAFKTWKLEPPPELAGSYRIPMAYDPEARTWSPRPFDETPPSASVEFPPGGPASALEFEHFMVPRVSSESFQPELNEILNVVHHGHKPRPRAIDGPYRERYDTAVAELPEAQRDALRWFVESDPLLSQSPSSGTTPGGDAAHELLQRYRDLRDALHALPAKPTDGTPLLIVGEPALAGKFAVGDIVTGGDAPLSATTNGRQARRRFADQRATGARDPNGARLLFAVQGSSARPLPGTFAPGGDGSHAAAFPPGTRFRIESITRATPRHGQFFPRGERQWVDPRARLDRPPLVIVRLAEMMPFEGPAPNVDAKNLRTGAIQPVLRPDIDANRLDAMLFGASAAPDAHGMHTLSQGGKLAHVDGQWQPVHHSRERQRWELFDQRRSGEPGMPIVRDDDGSGAWRSVVPPAAAAEPKGALAAPRDGVQRGADGRSYIALHGRYYPVHYDATFRTWRIVGERPAKTPRSFLLAQANKGGTPVRVDRGTGQWDIPEVAYKRFKLQAAASGSLGAGGGASSGTNALISRSVDVARVMETLSRSTATAYAQLPRNVLGLAQRQDFTVLYRVDSRPPWEIARHGFGSSDASDGYDIPAMLLSEDGGLPLVASETADGAYALSQRQRDAQPGSSWYLYAFNAEGRNAVSLRENYDHEVSRRVLEGMVPQGHRRLFADVSFNDARESQETHVEPDIPINRIRLLDTNAAATRQALSQALEQAADNVPYGAPVTAFADVGPAEPAVHMETDGGAQVESGIEGGEPQPPASTPIGNSRRVALSLQHDFEAAADAVPDASLQRNRLGFFERTDLGMAYRIDTRPPADIARDGFRSADRFDYMPPMLDPIGGQSPLIASATLGGAYEVIKWRHRDSTWYLYAFSAKGLHAVSLLDHLYRSERALARVFNDDVLVKNRKRPYENARRFAVMHIGTKVQAERVHLLDTNDPAMRARLSQALANRDSPETTCGISLSEVTGSEAAGPSEENLALARGTVNSAHLIARTDFATLYRVDARNPEDIADTGLGQSTDFGGTQGYSMLGGPALIASETRDGADAVRRSQFEDGAGAMQGSDNEDSPDAMQWSDDEGGLRSSHSPGHWYLYSIDAQGLRAASLLDNQRNAPQALSALLGENVAGRPPLELANGAGAFAETHVEPVTDARRVRLVDTNDPAFSNRLKEARQRYPDYVAGVPVTAFRMGGLAR